MLKTTGIPLSKFFNGRKGFYGLNAQACCDAWCRFIIFEVLFPGSTHDLKAYVNGPFFRDIIPHLDPNLFYFALDEAYKAIKDGKHLTPFPQVDIDKASIQGMHQAANMMRTFNKIFCSDRITIERAFGQLVRRWGILWLALPTRNFEEIQLILRVAVKLHNLCVDEWLCNKFGFLTEQGQRGERYPYPKLPEFIPDGLDDYHTILCLNDYCPSANVDIEELSDEYLLDSDKTKNLRGSKNTDTLFSSEDPTVIAGHAMSTLDDETNLEENALFLELLNSKYDCGTGNLSSIKRLKYCTSISDAGLFYDGPNLTLRER